MSSISFSFLNALTRTSSKMLNRSGESGILYVSDVKEKTFILLLVSMT